MCIPWTHLILQEIYQGLYLEGWAIDSINWPKSQIQMDNSTPYSLLDAKNCSYTSTHLVLTWSNKMIHSIHRCIRWYMWNATITRTWWNGISSSLSLFTEPQRKWSTTEQEAYRVYYAVMQWNYYLQGAKIIKYNDCKPLARLLNGKNANNKMNRWWLELATYSITFDWISGPWIQGSWLSLQTSQSTTW